MSHKLLNMLVKIVKKTFYIIKYMSIKYRTTNNIMNSVENLDMLLNLSEYNDIVWLKFNEVIFNNKITFPNELQTIYISDCKNLKNLEILPLSISFIEIKKCNATNLNNLFIKDMNNVETIILSCNRL